LKILCEKILIISQRFFGIPPFRFYAQSFLETKIEGQPRRLDGVYHPVEIYYRDYRRASNSVCSGDESSASGPNGAGSEESSRSARNNRY
jgi:hypothetical protein